MRAFARWYFHISKSQAGTFLEARPSPVLILSTSRYYLLFITARGGNFIEILDDQDAGSIPSEQVLGPLSTEPSLVLRRALDTALWYAKKNFEAGFLDRGNWYLRTVNHVAKYAGETLLAKETDIMMWEKLVEKSKHDPAGAANEFGLWGQKFSQQGEWELAVKARLLAGDAAERAFAEGDQRFDGSARVAYEIALSYIPEGLGEDLRTEIRNRLSNQA